MSYEHPEWFDLLNRTFLAQKEVFMHRNPGRQMGYGQGYLNAVGDYAGPLRGMTGRH